MGRTHNKDSTFPRAADHMGFVAKEDVSELCKCILAAQRDHGNREIRANARMKYLVHNLGIDGFRTLVEGYFGKPVAPWRQLPEWQYTDWMGWHAQGDGKYFLGINIAQGRVRDYDDRALEPVTGSSMGSLRNVKVRSALHKLVSELHLPLVLTPTQSIIIKDVLPEQRSTVDAILAAHGVQRIEDVDPLVRQGMACPALPLCGLAITEAERRMPAWVENTRALMTKLGLVNAAEIVPNDENNDNTAVTPPPHQYQHKQEQIMMRMTGCPNGCARPYMSELALVGDGPDHYQIWAGGSPQLTHVASVYKNKIKWADVDREVEPLLACWKEQRATPVEAFGTFCNRVGMEALSSYSLAYYNK